MDDLARNDELVRATLAGDLDQVKKLIEAGADPNSVDANGMGTLLTFHPKVTKYLLEQGANPDIQRNENILPVLPAVTSNIECVKLMLAAGADPNIASEHNGETALHFAASGNNVELTRMLLAAGAKPNAKTKPGMKTFALWRDARVKGETPLHRAAAWGSPEVVQLLLDAGADPTVRDANHDTPLSWASWYQRDKPIIDQLWYEGSGVGPDIPPGTVSTKLEGDLSKLIQAVRNSDVNVVKLLLGKNPKLANQRIDGYDAGQSRTLLHLVMPGDGSEQTSAHLEIATLLLDHGADVNALGNGPNLGQCRPLTIAAWGGHVELMKLLIDRGAVVDGNPGCLQKGPLYAAAGHGHTAAVECLVQAGAQYELSEIVMAGLQDRVVGHLDRDPDLINRVTGKDAALLHAALETRPGSQLVSMLLERGADTSIQDAHGRTPLQMAIEQQMWWDVSVIISILREKDAANDIFAAAGLGDLEKVKRVLDENLDLAKSTQTDGTTPLFYAVISGRADIVQLLLESGADPSPNSNRFWCCLTPLHLSLQQKQNEITKMLVSHDADVNAHGDCIVRWQPTPLHVAARWGGNEEIELLLDHGADMYVGGSGNLLGWAFTKERMKLMIDRGLDLGHPACRFLLHNAAARGRVELFKYLLDMGVDPAARNEQGQTVLQVAQAHGQNELAEILSSHRTTNREFNQDIK